MVAGEKDGPVIFLWNGEKNVATLVTRILHYIGVPANLKGYYYLREAIVLAANDEDHNNAVRKCRYNEVAHIFGTTAKRVEHAIGLQSRLLGTVAIWIHYSITSVIRYPI